MGARIGDWTFDPASGELRRNGERRRLEPRASHALTILLGADGDIVPQERLIAEVWNGRNLSANSVPVVISQLRRALDDDARTPAIIETVPKRGYRLVRPESGASDLPRRRRLVGAAATALALLLGLVWLIPSPSAAGPAMLVTDVVNETGNPGYTPHARATSELIVDQLRKRGFAVRRQGSADLRLASKLVMWNGGPSLGITVTGPDGIVRWSAMTDGRPAAVPAAVEAKLAQLQSELAGDR